MTAAAADGRPGLLVVDDDELILDLLVEELSDSYDVVGVRMRSEVSRAVGQLGAPPRFALVDLGLPPHTNSPREGLGLVRELVATIPDCAVIVISGQSEEEHGKVARTLGAIDYITKPCDPARIREALGRAGSAGITHAKVGGLLGGSKAMSRLRTQIAQFAKAQYPVLIEGESGTGKELVARALHQQSKRGGPFVATNCAAIPEQLFEATLFGARRGSYTGATSDSTGLFAAGDGGTLFLDEVGDMAVDLQPKLLRAIETGEFNRVGDAKPTAADVRIIAATNRPLRDALATRRFREDLYHRLSVLMIKTPALRELGDDRMLMLEAFGAAAAKAAGEEPFFLDDKARSLWLRYRFPGNVRELRNVVARLQVKHPGAAITDAVLGDELLLEEGGQRSLADLLDDDARRHAAAALDRHGDAAGAAGALGITEKRLRELLGRK